MAAWTAVVVSLASTAYSAYSSHEAANDQRDAAKEQQALANLNAANASAENLEMQRRTEREQESSESMSRAKAAASGVDISSGSTGGYLDDMAAENDLQLDWMKRSGLANVSLIQKGGQAAYSAGMAAADNTQNSWIAEGISSVGGAAGKVTASYFTEPGVAEK